MTFKISPLAVPGLLVLDPLVHEDHRGLFWETFKASEFRDMGLPDQFCQDNHSLSRRGVVRGLHYQLPPHGQAKLVRCLSGEIFDVAVDVRRGSETFGRWAALVLSAENKRMFYIPEGFAHGFLVLSDTAEFCYKCTRLYAPGDELGVRYDDPDVGVAWPDCGAPLTLSPKDLAQPSYKEACRRLFGEK